jgi:hypothetical protein
MDALAIGAPTAAVPEILRADGVAGVGVLESLPPPQATSTAGREMAAICCTSRWSFKVSRFTLVVQGHGPAGWLCGDSSGGGSLAGIGQTVDRPHERAAGVNKLAPGIRRESKNATI